MGKGARCGGWGGVMAVCDSRAGGRRGPLGCDPFRPKRLCLMWALLAVRSVQARCACGRCERSVPSKRLCLVGVVSGEVGPARGGRETVCARVASRLLCGADALCRGVSAVWPLCPLQCAVRHWPECGGGVSCKLRVCALQALQGSTRVGLIIANWSDLPTVAC